MTLDKQHPRPVYLQLKEMLRSQIEQGKYRSHQKLPSERDLCQHYKLSRMTARRALKELIDEGFAYTRVGKGTFVNYNTNRSSKPSQARTQEIPSLDLAGIITAHYQQKLIDQLLCFNTIGAEQVISDALASHSLEAVAIKLFPDVIRQIERKWQHGEISLLAQNYCLTTVRSQLIAMVSAAPPDETGPRVLLACAPGDHHEIGLLLLALSLRRSGCQVIYLGPNIAPADFDQVTSMIQPNLICFSASTDESSQALIALSHQYRPTAALQINGGSQVSSGTLLTFGGVAFAENPDLVPEVSGLYLGNTIEDGLTRIQDILAL